MEDTASTSEQTYRLKHDREWRALKYALEITEVASVPVKYIIAHFIVATILIATAQGMKVFLSYIDYSQETVLGSHITVREIVDGLEIIWLIVILSSGVYQGAKKVWEAEK